MLGAQIAVRELEADILVAGGGPSGVPCALAAARQGMKVVLVHDRPVLGGNASSEVRMHIAGAQGFRPNKTTTVEAREGGIMEEIRLDLAVHNPQRSSSVLDLLLYDKIKREPNITLLLNATVDGAVTERKLDRPRITHALASRPSTQERFRIAARVFVDCTGDGRLGAEAGAPFMEGRESRDMFNESLAQEIRDNKRLGSSLLLMARHHDKPMPFTAPPWIRRFTRNDMKKRFHIEAGGEKPVLEYGFWWAEWGGQHDTIRDNEMIRDELTRIMIGIWDYIKNGPADETDPQVLAKWQANTSQWALEWVGSIPGKRESRRFIGHHILTQNDLVNSVRQSDAIAFGGWSMDLHPPEGVDRPDESPCIQHELPHLYDIPLGMCVSREVTNLLFAGRNASATHVAFASTRVMATCAVMGQGVGTAATISVKRGVEPHSLVADRQAISEIQQQLLLDDCYLIGVASRHPDDVAPTARITASSQQPAGEATQVITGQTRFVTGEHGAPPDRAGGAGMHRWMSDPAAGLPASLTLTWPNAVNLARVILIFDTGMHRHLTLSMSTWYTGKMMKWGAPQPETVRDYRIEALVRNEWRTVGEAAGNYQRRREHRFESPLNTTALRVVVTTTNGADHARICGIHAMIR